jgi:hypothetical protein
MQLFVLLMMMALLAHDMANPWVGEPMLGGWRMVAAAVGPYALIALGLWLACVRGRRMLERRPERARRTLNRLDRLIGLSRPILLGLLLADLYALGWLRWLHGTIGQWMLINDLIAIAPVISTLVLGWWAYYPIDRRMRQAALAWQFEDGSAARAVGTRWQ